MYIHVYTDDFTVIEIGLFAVVKISFSCCGNHSPYRSSLMLVRNSEMAQFTRARKNSADVMGA